MRGRLACGEARPKCSCCMLGARLLASTLCARSSPFWCLRAGARARVYVWLLVPCVRGAACVHVTARPVCVDHVDLAATTAAFAAVKSSMFAEATGETVLATVWGSLGTTPITGGWMRPPSRTPAFSPGVPHTAISPPRCCRTYAIAPRSVLIAPPPRTWPLTGLISGRFLPEPEPEPGISNIKSAARQKDWQFCKLQLFNY
jgi:hypothetical protein